MRTKKWMCLLCMSIGLSLAALSARPKWTVEQAKAWAAEHPWCCGINYVPSYAMNDVEIWQKMTFSPKIIREELALAQDLGFNCVRIFLQYKVYEDNPKWFRKAFEKFVRMADEAGMTVMPTLFDDCAFGPTTDPQLGKQADPYPGWFMWGWVPSPGRTMVMDDRTHGKLEAYVKDLVTRYRDDKRILLWDLYNEPANNTGWYSKYSYILTRKCFEWAREADASQPLSVGPWNGDEELMKICVEESDVITYHAYFPAEGTRQMIRKMEQYGRPMICTEWLHRDNGNFIETCLPIYKEEGVGCMLWSLVTGRCQQTMWKDNVPGQNLFDKDHNAYIPSELEFIKKMTTSPRD